MIRVAINGFGRIGRVVLRQGLKRKDIEFVAVNDLTDNKTLAYLFKYDSIHGVYPEEVSFSDNSISIGGKKINSYSISDPEQLPWKKLKVDVVLECTGKLKKREDFDKHIKAGAKKVIISAPAEGVDETIVLGVNNNSLSDRQKTCYSAASCTTNCLAPVAMVLEKEFGIVSGMMNTIHAYTNDQKLMDAPHKDLRRARAAAQSVIPTTTGATKAVAIVLPSLKGKMDGISLRVPVPNGSITDFVCVLKKTVTKDEVNSAFKKAAETYLKGILLYSEENLVSHDIIGSTYSSIVDSQLTQVVNKNMVRVMAWYDNEWGYSARMLDLITKV
ncbi:MAG: type I glyceraldehyde-3-phosphate dehydrogenase [archaeon]